MKVNFSQEEASSEARSFEPIPSSTYPARITDIDLRECGPASKNAGKPYWAVEFTIQEGEYEGRKVWTNAMLFDGALYTVAQILKATGFEDALQTGELPEADDLISAEVNVVVKKQRDTYAEERDGDGEVQWKNEVKGIKAPSTLSAANGGSSKAKKGSGSILP